MPTSGVTAVPVQVRHPLAHIEKGDTFYSMFQEEGGTSALVAVHALFNVKLIKLENAMMKEKISMSRNFSQAFIVGFHYLLPFILHRNIVTRFLIKQRYSLMNPNFLQVKLKCPQVNLLSSVLNLKYGSNTYSEGVSYIKQSR